VREWGIEPFDCATDKGWGASDEVWLSPDTLRFTRYELPPPGTRTVDSIGAPQYLTHPMLVVRAETSWRIVPPPESGGRRYRLLTRP
jgi:hypothetical protein